MWLRLLVVFGLLFPALVSAESAATRRRADGVGSNTLPVPATLRPQVEFWKLIFAKYGDNQVVIHDSENLGRIYRVLDFSDLAAAGVGEGEMQRVREESVAAEKEYTRNALLHVADCGGDTAGLNDDERKLARLFRGASSDEIRAAASTDRVRAQRGIKERFERGVAVSRRYSPELERIFTQEGVPAAVTRLPLVESCFNVQAYSKVGAAGVWQFMPGTGRLFMRVDDVIDERRDPLIAGRGAARFLRKSYDRLGTWPLAITAYNHGPNGIAKAVEYTGTDDIGRIVQSYRGPLFGFASRNFYAEFVAAVEIDDRYVDHFPYLEVHRPIPTELVHFPQPVSIGTALQVTALDRETFIDLNPAIGESIRSGRSMIPSGYDVRVPLGEGADARVRIAGLPPPRREASSRQARAVGKPGKKAKSGEARKAFLVHKVQKGQTLTQIAKRYGTTVDKIKVANRLGAGGIRTGQSLRVPTG